MSIWTEYENIEDVLCVRYANIKSHWAMKFADELKRNNFADRNIRSITMRRGRIHITVHFQAKIENGKLYARYITK